VVAGNVATLAGRDRSYLFAMLAETFGKVGEIAQGLSRLAEELANCRKTGESFYEAELNRIKGKLLLRQPTPDEEQAKACFEEAIAVARRQSAKSLELRAAMSLSRLWQRQGKEDEARQLLAGIYGWFTEGFDTADLKAAKALLEELS
jgi:predicted ATPase